MSNFSFGRKFITLSEGEASLTKVSVTEKSQFDEDEKSFTERLLLKYEQQEGMMEIVFKNGRPDYAIITSEKK